MGVNRVVASVLVCLFYHWQLSEEAEGFNVVLPKAGYAHPE
jgi:hypothetical protein